MLAYASPHRFGARRFSPAGLATVALLHALAIGALITAKTVIDRQRDPGTEILNIPLDTPPPPPETKPQDPAQPTADPLYVPPTTIPIPLPPRDPIATTADPVPPGPIVLDPGKSLDPPLPPYTPTLPPVRKPAVFATPASDLEPPYPPSKLDAGEQARLSLALELNAEGRVIGVSAIGRVDPVFFAAAKKHILAHWRYRPATEDGKPVASRVKGFVEFKLLD